MKKIFILGASRLQVPAIKAAKERGLYVYVLDYDNCAVGIPYADTFLCISTIDKEAVLAAAMKYKPDYIITSTSDMPVRTVSWVNEQLGNPVDITYEDSICATDKAAMRHRMKEHGVPIPAFQVVDTYEEFETAVTQMEDLFVIKPADNAGSRGVILVEKNKAPEYRKLYSFCRSFSRSGEVLLEQFMTGPEVSVESFTTEKMTQIISITDKTVTDRPYFVELGHTEPSRLPLDIQNEIKKVTIDAVAAVGVINGPTHTELKITPDGVKLVEIAARLGGDFITSRLVPLSTGVDMIGCSFSVLLGEKADTRKKWDRGAAIRFIQGMSGKLISINGVKEAESFPGVIEIELYKSVGDVVHQPQSSSDRLGHVIAVGQSAEEAQINAINALNAIEVVVDRTAASMER